MAVALPAQAPAPAGAATAPRLDVLSRPTDLGPGANGHVVVRTENLRVCTLTLQRRGGPRSASTPITVPPEAQLVWDWTVPASVRAGRWSGLIECSTSNTTGAARAGTVERLEGRVAGARRGTTRFVRRGLITATVTPAETRSLLERGADLSAIVAGLLGFPTLVLILLSLRATRRGTRSERTAGTTDRYIADEFTTPWDKVKPFLDADDEEQCLERIRCYEQAASNKDPIIGADSATRNDIDSVLYLHELIGALFNRGDIDHPLVYRTFASATVDALQRSWWMLHYLREGLCVPVRPHYVRDHEDEFYAEWERMARVILRKRPDVRRRLGAAGTGRVRALCLPEYKDPHGDWDHCKALSKAIGDLLRTDPGTQRLRTAVSTELAGVPRPPQPATRTILVPEFETHIAAPARAVRYVTRAGARLDGRPGYDRIARPRWLRRIGVGMTRADRRVGLCESWTELSDDLNRLRSVRSAQAISDLVAGL